MRYTMCVCVSKLFGLAKQFVLNLPNNLLKDAFIHIVTLIVIL